MNDDEIGDIWTLFNPTVSRRRRIDARVFGWLEAHDTSLASEWLGLLRVAPFRTLALATVSAVALAANLSDGDVRPTGDERRALPRARVDAPGRFGTGGHVANG